MELHKQQCKLMSEVVLFVFKAGTKPAVNALSCQTHNIPVKQPPSSLSS